MQAVTSLKNYLLFKISLTVICLHAMILLWAIFSSKPLSLKKTSSRLIVNTFSFQSTEVPTLIAEPAPNSEIKKRENHYNQEITRKEKVQENKVKPAILKKKAFNKTTSPPLIKKKETAPLIKSTPAKQPSEMKTKIAQAQASIAKIQLNKEMRTPLSTDFPKLPDTELSQGKNFDSQNGYRDEIASRLKLLLTLPEEGVVKIELTLDREGNVKKVYVLQAKSEHNKKYVEKAVKNLSFPSFASNFPGLSEYVFTIYLSG
jgi:outer membrane biosynthesis protein TonB